MAGGKPVDLDGYRLVVKPLSRWRRLTRDFWPYWQAQKPRFLLEATRIGPPAQSTTITWFVRFANAQVAGGRVILPPLQTSGRISLEIGGRISWIHGRYIACRARKPFFSQPGAISHPLCLSHNAQSLDFLGNCGGPIGRPSCQPTSIPFQSVKADSVISGCEPYVQLIIEATEGCKPSWMIANYMNQDTKA